MLGVNKLLLVDGSNLLFQMFFGMPARITNGNGVAIQGTLGFVGALLRIIKMTSPTHVLVLFDAEQENARAELLPAYKSNRPSFENVPEEESPFSQLPDIVRALEYMQITHGEVIGAETDDAIASYVYVYDKQMQIVISSFDSDFFQLISDNTNVLRYRGDKTILCDAAYVQEKCGVSPEQYVDFKSLTGDASDSIRGADKIGPKTAAQLISQFGTLDAIITRTNEIAKPSIRESILLNADRLVLNRKLIKLDGKADIPFTIEQTVYNYKGITTNEVLRGIGLR